MDTKLTLEDLIGFVGEDAKPGAALGDRLYLLLSERDDKRLTMDAYNEFARSHGFGFVYKDYLKDGQMVLLNSDVSTVIRRHEPGDPMPWRDERRTLGIDSIPEGVAAIAGAGSPGGNKYRATVHNLTIGGVEFPIEIDERIPEGVVAIAHTTAEEIKIEGVFEFTPPEYEYKTVLYWTEGPGDDGQSEPTPAEADGWQKVRAFSPKKLKGLSGQLGAMRDELTYAGYTLSVRKHRRQIPPPPERVHEHCPSDTPLRGDWPATGRPAGPVVRGEG